MDIITFMCLFLAMGIRLDNNRIHHFDHLQLNFLQNLFIFLVGFYENEIVDKFKSLDIDKIGN